MKIHKFKLPLNKDNEILQFNKKIIVVSIFGKSRINSASYKTWCLDTVQGYPILRPMLFEEQNVDSDSLCEIDGFFDSKKKIIYLHLRGIYDLDTLIKTYTSLTRKLEIRGFLQIWSELKNKYAKALLYLFLTSHILFAVHPNQTFDLSYIQLFRALDQIRLQSQPTISKILNTIENIPQEWATNGRLGSPRLLFIFENSSPMNPINSIKKLAHSIEDQIYHILRKSRIVANNSSNCLFAIPPNQEFVYVRPKTEQRELDLTAHLVNSLISFCQDPNSSFTTELSDSDTQEEEESFEPFLMRHVDEAFNKGFDDNVGRHSQPIHFEVPRINLWFQAANKLFDVLINSNIETEQTISEDEPNEEENENMNRPLKALEKLLDTDVSFSEARCSKILPLATARYMENLPPHYSREHHNTRLAHALCVLGVNARGPLLEKYSDQLEQDCKRVWIPDRQVCEVLSLTGNSCTKPTHTLSSSEDRDAGSPEHCSGIRYISTCDCGRRQSSREDPFTARAANYEFYQQIGKECGCIKLERHHFPIFEPTTQQFRAAQLFPTAIKSGRRDSGAKELSKDLSTKEQTTTPHTQAFSFAGFASGTSLGSCDVLPEDSANLKDVSQTDSSSQHPIVIEVSSEQNDSKEKSLVRQPSTTEYLPSMPHTLSPVGLLPRYPCWSLVCLGPSSLYSHNVGLQEQWHEGFLPGCSHLLPWDLTVRLKGRPGWIRHNPRKNQQNSNQPTTTTTDRTKELNEFVVKIFIGVEYECPRGHRFMCASPDRVLKTSGQGIVKDNGNRVTSSDMPLYFSCPCRSSKPLVAQLMRIHVVTPKAPVHVTLNPRVQPSTAPCPIFVPGASGPMRLSQSTYWVLRLPFIYVGDEGPIPSPKDASLGVDCGRFLSGCYGISEMTEETK